MIRVGVITTARSDFTSQLPIAERLQRDPDTELVLIAGGMHLAPRFGRTISEIEEAGLPVAATVDFLPDEDSGAATGRSLGRALAVFTDALAEHPVDVLLLVGDRIELLAAASAALALNIPIAHVSGGDITEGAVDNQVRFAVSKMSHIHFPALEEHRRRLLQIGEEDWRITVTGEPALDALSELELLDRQELEEFLNHELEPPVGVVTFHPATLSATRVEDQVAGLVEALDTFPGTLVWTWPNADTGHNVIIERMKQFAGGHANTVLVENLGRTRYYSLLAIADVMIGNSSSGIWESPTFRLPVVNIGERQQGRVRARNVIDCGYDAGEIRSSIERALTPGFRRSLEGLENPYGAGDAVAKIIAAVKSAVIRADILTKQFVDTTGD